jgi:hypothetical protein
VQPTKKQRGALFWILPPGNQVIGTLVFDIPKKTKPAKLLLKAGVFGFSVGVTVDVS